MEPTVVRYKTKPGQADENARLVEAVFEELRRTAPPGTRYAVLRLDDGSFVHIAFSPEGAVSPPDLEAFSRFSSGVKDRCIEPPVVCSAKVVGNYGMLA